jgi:hypothetical protein
VPQSYSAGQEAQVDWFEAQVKLGGEARTLQFFAMRSMHSGGGSIAKFDSKTERPGNVLFGGPYLRALQQFGLGR